MVKKIFEENNIELSRIKITSFGIDKPRVLPTELQKNKLPHKQALIEINNTYVYAKIKHR